MKIAEVEVWECYVGQCPYCKAEIHEMWKRAADYTMVDLEDGDELVCLNCKKEFRIKIVKTIE